ncbi:MAG: tRNA (adenosine(37)-N6)-dimethylallyltransferase MiaA [Gemmatimonadota bacterium]|nr:tRNA (adenosine(37)-N6)-dimethylallyltransferase MiaA [Gemmatimonadota bacterium]MDH5760848.1 tRNA (adenosine(37)-N6)-dimethylallyltransferase MiaA [Gemmatimonadota bacterium]
MKGSPHSRPAFLAITGPTASGKTALSLALARHLPMEIVSMDSRQVYRGMDVGTAKVTVEERAAVPHHGLDLVDPDERYSAGRFARDVRSWIPEITGRGRIPVLVGGTGFFLKAVMEPIFAEPPMDPRRRDALRQYLAGQGRERLATWVRWLDPERAELAVEGGPQRMSRTLEVALLTGRPLSWWHRTSAPEGEAVPGVVVVLDLPKEEMDRHIDERVPGMFDRGLVEEVRALRVAGYSWDDPGMTGTGYREMREYLEGEADLDATVETIRLNTRRYARRQLTWFRNQLPADTTRLEASAPMAEKVAAVLAAWAKAQSDEEETTG